LSSLIWSLTRGSHSQAQPSNLKVAPLPLPACLFALPESWPSFSVLLAPTRELKWTERSNPSRTGPWPWTEPWSDCGRINTVNFRVKGESTHHWTGPWPDRGPSRVLPWFGPTVRFSLHSKMGRADPSRTDPWTGQNCGPCGTVPNRTASPVITCYNFFSIIQFFKLLKIYN
jgi:hypothetical protein